jgi:hypothetical protein
VCAYDWAGKVCQPEMAAKTAFLLASYQSRVSEDWVVEPGTR